MRVFKTLHPMYYGFFFAALALALGIAFFYTVEMNRTLSKEMNALKQAFAGGNSLLYGTVTDIDPSTRTITFQTLNQYDRDGDMVTYSARVRDNAVVGRQSLVRGQNGAYVSTTNFEPIDLSAVQPGNRVAAFLYRIGSQPIQEVMYLVVGNPI